MFKILIFNLKLLPKKFKNEKQREDINEFRRTKEQYFEKKFRPEDDKNMQKIRELNSYLNEKEKEIDDLTEKIQKVDALLENNKSTMQEIELESFKNKEEVRKLRVRIKTEYLSYNFKFNLYFLSMYRYSNSTLTIK